MDRLKEHASQIQSWMGRSHDYLQHLEMHFKILKMSKYESLTGADPGIYIGGAPCIVMPVVWEPLKSQAGPSGLVGARVEGGGGGKGKLLGIRNLRSFLLKDPNDFRKM